jgi:hypothetical protein
MVMMVYAGYYGNEFMLLPLSITILTRFGAGKMRAKMKR